MCPARSVPQTRPGAKNKIFCSRSRQLQHQRRQVLECASLRKICMYIYIYVYIYIYILDTYKCMQKQYIWFRRLLGRIRYFQGRSEITYCKSWHCCASSIRALGGNSLNTPCYEVGSPQSEILGDATDNCSICMPKILRFQAEGVGGRHDTTGFLPDPYFGIARSNSQ